MITGAWILFGKQICAPAATRRLPFRVISKPGLVAGIGALGVWLVRRWIVAIKVQGWSMAPTLLPGQRLLAERWSYMWRPPRQGEVVVIRRSPGFHQRAAADQPAGSGLAVKRVVGVPRGLARVSKSKGMVGGQADIAALSGRGYWGDEVGPAVAANADPPEQFVPIPDGSFYVLGDNYGASQDSRVWGPIARHEIVARVWLVKDARWRPISRQPAGHTVAPSGSC